MDAHLGSGRGGGRRRPAGRGGQPHPRPHAVRTDRATPLGDARSTDPSRRSAAMYAHRIATSTTIRAIKALSEEPGFRGVDQTPSGTLMSLWESEASSRSGPGFGGRLLNVYRASGRPA